MIQNKSAFSDESSYSTTFLWNISTQQLSVKVLVFCNKQRFLLHDLTNYTGSYAHHRSTLKHSRLRAYALGFHSVKTAAVALNLCHYSCNVATLQTFRNNILRRLRLKALVATSARDEGLATWYAAILNYDYNSILQRLSRTEKTFLCFLGGYVRKRRRNTLLNIQPHTLLSKRRHWRTTAFKTPQYSNLSHN